MLSTRVSTETANHEADATASLCNKGYLRVYGGVQPDDSDLPAPDVAYAVLRFADVAFQPASGGVVVSNPITPDMSTVGGGEPTWFRTFREDGVTAVFDGSVGTANCNINVKTNGDVALIVHPGGEFHIGSISYAVKRG